MQLVRYNPFRELQKLERDMNKFWGSGWGMLQAFAETSAMDFYEEDGNLVAEVSLHSFKKDEVKVTTDKGVLEVLSDHKEEEEKNGKRRYCFHESSNNYFRQVTLPEGVKVDKAEASFKVGSLKVTMPMITPKKTKSVTVK